MVRGMLQQQTPCTPQVDPSVRCVVLDWMMEVSDEFGLKRPTYHLASQIFDAFLSRASKPKI